MCIPADITETLVRLSVFEWVGAAGGGVTDWLNRCGELKRAVSWGINSFPPSPRPSMKHMEAIKDWESYGTAEQNTQNTCRETAQKKERSWGRENVYYRAFRMAGLSFTDILHQQLSLLSLSTKGNNMKDFLWGQWKAWQLLWGRPTQLHLERGQPIIPHLVHGGQPVKC